MSQSDVRVPLFLYPGHQRTVKTVLIGVVVSWLVVMVREQAHEFAFVLWPAIMWLLYAQSAGMNWKRSKTAAVVKWALCGIYVAVGEFAIAYFALFERTLQ